MVLMKVLLFLHNRQKWFGEKRHWAHRCMGYTDYAEGRRLTEGRMSLALFPLTPSLTPSWTPLHKPGTLQDKLTSATIPDISFTESITPVSLCWQWGLESSVSKAPNGVGIQRNWVAACFFFFFYFLPQILIPLISVWGPIRLEESCHSSRDRARALTKSTIPLAKRLCVWPKSVQAQWIP